MERIRLNQTQASVAGEDAVVAAVDLGSNSFHMLVARIDGAAFQIIDKLREPVRLAAGLDAEGVIEDTARTRALASLARFGQRLRGFSSAQVRVVGTNTLREAVNADSFMRDAEQVLGHPIEVISGMEEARLIYAGVVHGLASDHPGRLVTDIGGGSTEIIVGQDVRPQLMESLPLGCVVLTEHFFPDGRMNDKVWRAARMHAERAIQPYADAFRRQGWQQVIGASGTVRAIQKVLEAEGWSGFSITREGLDRLGEVLRGSKNAFRIKLKGLSERRRDVLPGGAVILSALFNALNLEKMDVSDSALREGLLLDFVERREHRDVRAQSVRMMAERFGVDQAQGERVARTALGVFAGLASESTDWAGLSVYLEWASRLHELGLSISHSGYHKHGAYIVENADLMGFSRAEQALLAGLIRAHRGRLQLQAFESLPPRYKNAAPILAIVLRLAVLLHRGRGDSGLVAVGVDGGTKGVELRFPKGWLEQHPLTEDDLADEARALKRVKFDMRFS